MLYPVHISNTLFLLLFIPNCYLFYTLLHIWTNWQLPQRPVCCVWFRTFLIELLWAPVSWEHLCVLLISLGTFIDRNSPGRKWVQRQPHHSNQLTSQDTHVGKCLLGIRMHIDMHTMMNQRSHHLSKSGTGMRLLVLVSPEQLIKHNRKKDGNKIVNRICMRKIKNKQIKNSVRIETSYFWIKMFVFTLASYVLL